MVRIGNKYHGAERRCIEQGDREDVKATSGGVLFNSKRSQDENPCTSVLDFPILLCKCELVLDNFTQDSNQ